MSLINQVLRDLDQRHAGAVVMPSAVRALPVASVRVRSWPRLVIGAAVLVIVAGGASTLAWSLGARSVQVAPVALAPVTAAAPPPTPVVVVTAPVAVAQRTAEVVLPATASDSWPARTLVAPAPPTHVAMAAPLPATAAPAATTSTAVARGEPRIEKRAATHTARQRAEAEFERGVAAHQRSQWNEAGAAYTAALGEEPGFALARQALAGLLIGQGHAEAAKELLAEGLALAPQHAGLAMMAARLHAEHDELQEAAEILQTAAIASPSAEDRAFHAAILQRLNRHAEAAELFAAALRTAPHNGVWWMGMAMSLAADGRNDSAREAFNRARASGSLSPALAQYVEQRLRELM